MQDLHPPRSISDVKRHAKKLAKENELPHHAALDMAAEQYGFADFFEASEQLSRPTEDAPRKGSKKLFPFVISQRAHKGATQTSILFYLPVPAEKLIPTPRSLERIPGYYGRRWNQNHFRREADDYDGQNGIQALHQLARTLQFMATTGLVPDESDFTIRLRGLRPEGGLRWIDHVTDWHSPATGERLAVSEPYWNTGLRDPKCDEWAAKHDLVAGYPNWDGMYPGASPIIFARKSDEAFLKRIDRILTALPTLRETPGYQEIETSGKDWYVHQEPRPKSPDTCDTEV